MSKGGFREGSGRPMGSPNKATKELRDRINKILSSSEAKFTKELNLLTGKAYIDAIKDLMEFAIPKLQRQEIKHEIDELITVTLGGKPLKDGKS